MAYRANRELGLGAAKAFQLRMPADLWKRVEREATRNGRSLNAEVIRLVEMALGLLLPAGNRSAAEPPGSYGASNEAERSLLETFRAIPPEAQLALITLMRGLHHRGRKSDSRG